MAKLKRYVVGPRDDGRSAVLMTDATNVQESAGFFWRATLWSTREVPVDNSIAADRGLDLKSREPFPGGMLFRALEIPPDAKDQDAHRKRLLELNVEVEQKHAPSDEDLRRHPSMHRTDTLDCIVCVKGEIYLVTDVEEVLMTAGDTVVIRGTNHAWSNRSSEPALLVGCMIDAVPLEAEKST
ncbi:cupin domain-containing protein [Xanthobacter sp. KR7-225]|uniref:cupin domain-containing protein n=1 Tax=Xanthobacter sp. KR7-225 TaxID=3156613 RepID=UPI0032B34F0E